MQWCTKSNSNIKPCSYFVGVTPFLHETLVLPDVLLNICTLTSVIVPTLNDTVVVMICAVCKRPVITTRWSKISTAGLSFIVFTCGWEENSLLLKGFKINLTNYFHMLCMSKWNTLISCTSGWCLQLIHCNQGAGCVKLPWTNWILITGSQTT
jgi:hypothetical protein